MLSTCLLIMAILAADAKPAPPTRSIDDLRREVAESPVKQAVVGALGVAALEATGRPD